MSETHISGCPETPWKRSFACTGAEHITDSVVIAQAAFHVFGMELLAQLDIQATNNFFSTFFRLPDKYWRGFLASSLTSRQLIMFAMWMMVRAPPSIQFKLMQHMLLDPAGKYMLRTYAGMHTMGYPAQLLVRLKSQ